MFMVWDRVLRWKSFGLVSMFFLFVEKSEGILLFYLLFGRREYAGKGKNSKL